MAATGGLFVSFMKKLEAGSSTATVPTDAMASISSSLEYSQWSQERAKYFVANWVPPKL